MLFRSVIVFHSSGVTRRLVELPISHNHSITYKFVDDYRVFKANGNPTVNNALFFPSEFSLKKQMGQLLKRFFFLVELNCENDFLMLKPWTFMARGHYSQINLSSDEIEAVRELLQISKNISEKSNYDAIHFRLGDLLNLESKTFINPARLYRVIQYLDDAQTLNLYSDSSQEELCKVLPIEFLELCHLTDSTDVKVTINECVNSRDFIGTNSKISLWIVILRIHLGVTGSSYLPMEIRPSRRSRRSNQSRDPGKTIFY